MSASLELPQLNGPVETDVFVQTDRRATPRRECHTYVAAVPADAADGQSVLKAHSEDVSVSGAKLVTLEPFPGKRLFLRFLLPNFGNRFVEAEIVNESIRKRESLNGSVREMYVYGVRFTGVVRDDDVVPQPDSEEA